MGYDKMMIENRKRLDALWFTIGFVLSLILVLIVNIIYTKSIEKKVASSPDKPKLTVLSSVEQMNALEQEFSSQQKQLEDVSSSLDKLSSDIQDSPNQ